MEEQNKDHIEPEGLNQRRRLKQLQTHNLPTNDVENFKGNK